MPPSARSAPASRRWGSLSAARSSGQTAGPDTTGTNTARARATGAEPARPDTARAEATGPSAAAVTRSKGRAVRQALLDPGAAVGALARLDVPCGAGADASTRSARRSGVTAGGCRSTRAVR